MPVDSLFFVGVPYNGWSKVGEFRQCICTCHTNIQIAIAEEGKDHGNGMYNWLSELSYENISNLQDRKFDTLPCSESFDNASAAALRTFRSLSPRRAMIWGMTGSTNSRNSASEYINIVQVRNFDELPCSENSDNASALALRSFTSPWLRREMNWGMANVIKFLNSATSTSSTCRTKNLIPYLTLRVSITHLHPPCEHSTHYCWGGK